MDKDLIKGLCLCQRLYFLLKNMYTLSTGKPIFKIEKKKKKERKKKKKEGGNDQTQTSGPRAR